MAEWIEYKCKSGQTLFIYNKLTGEHKWLNVDGNGSLEDSILNGKPITHKEVRSIATQTDDNCCNNGCTSMYIDSIPRKSSNNSQISSQPQPIVLYRREDTLGAKSGAESRFVEVEKRQEQISPINVSSNSKNKKPELIEQESTPNSEVIDYPFSHRETINVTTDDNDHEYYVVHINPQSYSEAQYKPSQQTYHDNNDEIDDVITKPFQCSHCNKRFARKFNLHLHLRTHTGEKPFQCSYCSKKFAQKSNLYVHLRKHTGEKPYQCNQCDKVFGHKCNLYNHLRAHSGEKPFECFYCHKKFQGKRNLRVHLRSHTFTGED